MGKLFTRLDPEETPVAMMRLTGLDTEMYEAAVADSANISTDKMYLSVDTPLSVTSMNYQSGSNGRFFVFDPTASSTIATAIRTTIGKRLKHSEFTVDLYAGDYTLVNKSIFDYIYLPSMDTPRLGDNAFLQDDYPKLDHTTPVIDPFLRAVYWRYYVDNLDAIMSSLASS